MSGDLVTRLDAICNEYGATGVQVAVFLPDKFYTYNYGMADKDAGTYVNDNTKFRVASLSKLVTDMVFLCMAEDGFVSEEENIENYLGYMVRNPNYPQIIITPEMLMTHTSSSIDSEQFLQSRLNDSSIPIKQLLESSATFSRYSPGCDYCYSNFGVALIGAICEKASGEGFQSLADRYILDRLNIDAAYIASAIEDINNIGVLYGNGGRSKEAQLCEKFSSELGQTHHLVQGNLTISAHDYAKILRLLINDGVDENGQRILSSNSVEAILKSHFRNGDESIGYGLRTQYNFELRTVQSVHSGSNFGMYSSFMLFPESNSGVVVLTSGADGHINNKYDLYQVCYDISKIIYGDILDCAILGSKIE